ncbi:MAG: hypothetical protein WCK91_00715 [bacterium]
MDQTQLQQKIAEYFLKLSPQAQDKFKSMEWMDSLSKISAKYTLDTDQAQELATETTLVLLGIVSIEQYAESIDTNIKLPEDSLIKMLDELESEIIAEVRSDIDEAYTSNLKDISDNDKKLATDIDPRFATLPEELRHAIATSDYKQKLFDIATKYKLAINKMQPLEDITVRFIKGEISASQYENNLALDLDVEAGKARQIAGDINESILKAIRQTEKVDTTPSTEQEDEVPLPPYANPKTVEVTPKPVTAPSVPTTARDVYGEAGIEILDDSNTKTDLDAEEKSLTPKESVVFAQSGIDLIKEKLDGITSTKNTLSDHTLSRSSDEPIIPAKQTPAPTTPTPAVPTRARDPYHEAIEQ